MGYSAADLELIETYHKVARKEIDLKSLSSEMLLKCLETNLQIEAEDRRENQLWYYQPVSAKAREFHLSTAKTVCLFGGNGSSKTDSMLVELAIQSTGMIPKSLKDVYPKQKIKCPGNYRVVVESLKTTLYPIILPKLQWWKWDSEVGKPGSKQGHWGWIPKEFLVGWDWAKSWSASTNILRLTCGCTWQFMSGDQDPSDFASGSFHVCAHDEPPPKAIWNENRTRVMRGAGYMYLAMTPPDEAGINVDWIYDELYLKGMPGPAKSPRVDCFTLHTEANRHLNQQEVAGRASEMTKAQREVRLHGAFLSFSNRIHPLFTDNPQTWCYGCNQRLVVHDGECPDCHSRDLADYCHVEDRPVERHWPVVMLLDPHPRKPHALAWVVVDPNDDAYVVAEAEVDGTPAEVKARVDRIEQDLHLTVAARLMDPNMGESPANAEERSLTWRDEFRRAGLACAGAIDNFTTGKERINQALQPDGRTRRPRITVHPRCQRVQTDFMRFSWAEWARYATDDKSPKERPKDKHDDFPALLRYFYNGNFTFAALRRGAPVIHTRTPRYARPRPEDVRRVIERRL